MRCGSRGGSLRLDVRGRSQRRSTEQRRLARHPIPELLFDDRSVVGAEHSLQQRPELVLAALPDKVAQRRHEQQLDRLPQPFDRTPGGRRQHALGQAVHPVEQPALFRLAQRQNWCVRLRGVELYVQTGGDHVIVDLHAAALRDLARVSA